MANEFKIKKGLIVTGASGGTVVDIQGSQGQLFSVTDDLSGSIFAVSDISGVPIFDVNSSGLSTFDGLVSGITPVAAANFVTKAYVDGSGGGTGPFLPLAGGTMTGSNGVIFPDNFNLKIGTGSDLKIFHNATDSFIINEVGNLKITNGANDKDIIFESDDGSGGTTTYFQLDGSHMRSIAWKDIHFVDGIKAKFGDYASPDLEIFHDGSNSYIKDNGTGDLRIWADSPNISTLSGNKIFYGNNGAAELYHTGGVKKFETTSTGVEITGSASATTFLGNLQGGHTSGTISTGVLAVTQLDPVDNDTIATTAYVNNKIQLIPAGLAFEGTWDARTVAEGGAGTPPSASPLNGQFWIVSIDGSQNLSGITDWKVGDWAIYVDNGAGTDGWQKVDNSSVLDGSGTGGTMTAWAGSGTSNTLTDSPVTFTSAKVEIPRNVEVITSGYPYIDLGVSSSNYFRIIHDNPNDILKIGKNGAATASSVIINPSGNVGIGAVPVGNPGTKFLAVGTAGSVAGGIQLWASSSQTHYLQFGDANSGGEVYRGGIGYNHASETLLLLQGSATALSFTGSQAATFAGTIDSGTITSTGIVKAATTFQATSGDMTFYVNNVGEAMRIQQNTGNVGIGETSPDAPLHIKSTISTMLKLEQNDANGGLIRFLNTDDTAGWFTGITSTEKFMISRDASNAAPMITVEQNGNVGIGTATPDTKLMVSGEILSENSNGGYFVSTRVPSGSSRPTLNFYGTALDINYVTGYAGTLADTAVSILTNGNVGIGDTTPTSKLTILGTSTAASNTPSDAIVDIHGTSTAHLLMGVANVSPFGAWINTDDTAQPLVLMGTGGNVGIGTGSPTGLLTLQRPSTGANTDIDFLNEVGAGPKAKIRFGGTVEELAFYTGTTTLTERMRIEEGGNVGIGVTGPYTKLLVGSRGTAAATSISAIDGLAFDFYNDGPPYKRHGVIISQAGDASESVLDFNTKAASGTNSTKMTILGNGNVGIGTTSPGQKLHLNETGVTSVFAQWSNNSLTKNSYLGLSSAGMFAMQTNDNIAFYTGASYTERMHIDTAGAIQFNAYDSTNNTGTPTYLLGTDASGNVVKTLSSSAPGSLWAASGNDIYNTNSADVGIGITNPDSKLTVSSGTANNVANFKSTDGTAYIAISDNSSSGALVNQIGVVGDDMYFATADVERMRIDSAGNVLINTDTTSFDTAKIGSGHKFLNVQAPSEQYAVLTLAGNSETVSNRLGYIPFVNEDNSANYKYTAWLGCESEGTTANQRGGRLIFSTAEDGSSAGPIERMRITSAGNVGIGTTTFNNYWNGYAVLKLGADNGFFSNIASSTGSALFIAQNVYNDGNVYRYVATNESGLVDMRDGKFSFLTSPSGSAGAAATMTNRFTILQGGNVGIGTDSPSTPLQIGATTSGNQRFSSGSYGEWWTTETYPRVFLSRDGAASGVSALQFGVGSSAVDTTIQRLPSGPGVALMGGNVGIGTTVPQTKLAIGSAQGSGIDFLYDATNNYKHQIKNYWNSNTDSRMDFNIGRTSGQTPETIMSVGYGGNVGIGTASPAKKLHVKESTTATYAAYIENTIAGGDYLAMIGDAGDNVFEFDSGGTGGEAVLKMYSDGVLKNQFVANGTSWINGNVAIGATSSTKKLTVNGSFKLGTNSYIEYGGVYPYTITTANTAAVGNLVFSAGLGSTAYESRIDLQGTNTAGVAGITLSTASTARMVVTADGDVGIGTTTPLAKLDIQGTQGQLFSVTDDLSGSIFAVSDISGVPIFDVNSSGLSTFDGNVNLPDNKKILLGTGNDLEIYHNSTNSYIQNTTGNLYLSNNTPGADVVFQGPAGFGTNTATYFFLDGSQAIYPNGSPGRQITTFPDHSRLTFGTGNDLQIYHDGSNSYISDTGAGSLFIQGSDISIKTNLTENAIFAQGNGKVELFHNNITKFETTSTGVSVTGEGIFTGNVGIGITNPGSLLEIEGATNSSTSNLLRLSRASQGSAPEKVAGFYSGTSGEKGYITVNNFGTAYNTSSDYRLKENIKPIEDSVERLMSLKPCNFNFISEEEDKIVMDGFIAHEAKDVVPEAVTGIKDAVDEKGNPMYQGIDQSKIVPLLTAALQQALQRIEILEQKLNN